MDEFDATVDARQYAPKDKHATIFSALERLEPGQRLQLINDHDPKPLRYEMMAEMPDRFDWEYLEQGPDVWRVSITRK